MKSPLRTSPSLLHCPTAAPVRTLAAVLAALALAVPLSLLQADTFEWTGHGDGTSWNDGENWNRTEGTSGRFFPNDGSDIAILNQTLSADSTINVTDSFNFGELRVGDAGAVHNYIFSGTGSFNTGAMTFTLLDGATSQLDVDMNSGNFSWFSGSGTLIINSTLQTTRVWNTDSGTTVRVFGQMNTSNDNLRIRGKLEIANDDFTNAPSGINIFAAGTIASHGTDRVLTVPIHFGGGSGTAHFDGTNNLNLTINADSRLDVQSGSAAGMAILDVDTSRLTFGAGTLTVNDGNDRDLHRHPVRLQNDGTLELKTTSMVTPGEANPRDFVIDGTGTLLLNNTSGSATGSGNALVFGRTNHDSNTAVTMAGTGSTESVVVVGEAGRLAPGDGTTGTLTVGSVTFEGGNSLSEFYFNFDPSGDHGVLNVLGDIDAGAGLAQLTLFGVDYISSPTVLATYTGSLNYDFAPFWEEFYDSEGNASALPEGFFLDYDSGSISIVPEPATTGLLIGLSTLALLGLRRRR